LLEYAEEIHMPKPQCTWLIALLLFAACSPRPQALSRAHAAAIVDSVKATLAAFGERLDAADPDSLIRFYLDDPRFVWAADGQIATHSVAEVRAQFRSMAPFPRWHIDYRQPLIVPLAPGVAEVATEYTMTLRDSGGKDVTFGGANTMLWVASPAGWKILGGHSSSAPRR